MYSCVCCTDPACEHGSYENLPKNCPMRDLEKLESILTEYGKEEIRDFYINCSAVEAEGYGQWPRLRETAEFCKKMGYQKVGL